MRRKKADPIVTSSALTSRLQFAQAKKGKSDEPDFPSGKRRPISVNSSELKRGARLHASARATRLRPRLSAQSCIYCQDAPEEVRHARTAYSDLS